MLSFDDFYKRLNYLPLSITERPLRFKEKLMSERISIINKEGAKILLLDFSNLRGDDYVKVIKEAKDYFLKQPRTMVFDATISDSTNAKMNEAVKQELKNLDTALKGHYGEDYLDKSKEDGALSISVGVTGLHKIIAGFMMKNIKFMNTREEAIAYAVAESHKRAAAKG